MIFGPPQKVTKKSENSQNYVISSLALFSLSLIGSLLVKDGRHPLQEQCVETFVANDIGMINSEENHGHGKVIGKSNF